MTTYYIHNVARGRKVLAVRGSASTWANLIASFEITKLGGQWVVKDGLKVIAEFPTFAAARFAARRVAEDRFPGITEG
jgi:hypothetical protein